MTSYENYPASGTDAVARYQYLLRTAAPDQIERAHQQAFAQMTPAERRAVLEALSGTAEKPADDSAATLARSATRLEVAQPGALQSALNKAQSAAGGQTGRTLLASVAGGFIGSGLFSALTGGDGVGGRPGLLSRLLGGGWLAGGSFGGGRPEMLRQGGFFGGPDGPGHAGPQGLGGGFGGGPGGFGGGPGF